ncbi:MAG: 16S rRNA (guanine(966)-N(2))-methyltransferase RsmD [Gammaproteobacteria bacterium]|nr:16S rRNA (guanine(966)-N(2))-methyltransferase RsmD [Gammaproteobacteria bacterium]
MAKKNRGGAPGSLRIIGGEWRGRRLPIPASAGVRPTPDRVRETLFNWLRERVGGARCVDLYAGTGCLGLEALSRGAAEAWLVERDAALARALSAHVEKLGANAHVVCGRAEDFLARPVGTRLDLAFVDPPYAQPVEPIIAALLPLLAPRALVYVERPAGEGLPDIAGTEWHRRARAGSVEFGLLASG